MLSRILVASILGVVSLQSVATSAQSMDTANINNAALMKHVYGMFLNRHSQFSEELALTESDAAVLEQLAQDYESELSTHSEIARAAQLSFYAAIDFSTDAAGYARQEDRILYEQLNAASLFAEERLSSMSIDGRAAVQAVIDRIAAEGRLSTTKTPSEMAAEDPILYNANLAFKRATIVNGLSLEEAREQVRTLLEAGTFGIAEDE